MVRLEDTKEPIKKQIQTKSMFLAVAKEFKTTYILPVVFVINSLFRKTKEHKGCDQA